MFFCRTLIIVLIPLTSAFELEITRKENYSSLGHEVSVEKVKDNIFSHKFTQPLLLSDILQNGESVFFDKLFFREQPVKSISVYWQNDTPSLLQIYSDLSTVVLLNNGNGRFLEQGIMSTNFVSNHDKLSHEKESKRLSLELNRDGNYNKDGVQVNVTQLTKFDQRLEPYKVNYQNVNAFNLNGLTFNNQPVQLPLTNTLDSLELSEVNGVYVYSKDNNPVMVELATSTSNHKYYVKNAQGTWEQLLMPSIFDPTYNNYFVKKLRQHDNTCENKLTLDFSLQTPGVHNLNVKCTVKGKVKLFAKRFKVQTQDREVFTWYRGTLVKVTYELESKGTFALEALNFNNQKLELPLPTGPFNKITVYFYKCPLMVHFEGPNTNTYFEFVHHKPYKVFKNNTSLSNRDLKKKLDRILNEYKVKGIFFSFP